MGKDNEDKRFINKDRKNYRNKIGMPEVLVDINGRTHSISCSEGEEERVGYLSSLIGKEVSEIAGRVGQVGEMEAPNAVNIFL